MEELVLSEGSERGVAESMAEPLSRQGWLGRSVYEILKCLRRFG